MVQEAGGTVSREDGGPYTLDHRIIVASNGIIHDALTAAVSS